MSTSSEEYCKACKLSFPNWNSFHLHKMQSRRHICCAVCSQDFHTQSGYTRHRDLMHAAEQNLKCPGCGKEFTRVGGLVGHLELTECPVISPSEFAARRTEKGKWHDKLQNARLFDEYGAVAENFLDKSASVTSNGEIAKPTVAQGYLSAQSSQPNLDVGFLQSVGSGGPLTPHPLGKYGSNRTQGAAKDTYNERFMQDETTDDLLKFDVPSRTLNTPWGKEASRTILGIQNLTINHNLDAQASIFDKDVDFPLPAKTIGSLTSSIMDEPVSDPTYQVAGTASDNLTPKALVSLAPSLSMKDTETPLSRPMEENWEHDDPDGPRFRAGKYYVEFSRKYKCPHRGCKKSLDTASAFIQHLKSSAHRSEKLRCRDCLRYFGTATALTQHSEAQGVRCKVRETDQYSAAVDEFTAGTAATAGRHTDHTMRYVVNDQYRAKEIGPQSLVQAHKDANDAKDDKFYSYWDSREPKW